ncbi:BRO1-domain-containing protein [Dendrothele bispora CBS 962.96]|uniref:BRO domain-containing protein 1 n=1 Tax=Dendrothele bispora (strain CBS 962.96) TaxID=1314807 RepID=A0A4V6T5L3_DENBC|nr:BRO1-domain-containing protein [Dendrothele bispora CBS 962.96]
MAHQSPMISIPRKSTEEVDWTSPIRNLIAQSYGENPDNYATEYSSLQRCRQDAVRGAGSDITARDLLYKYFGQLELLELRFSEIRVQFPWRDAFTNKLITQTSIAYEKASILFQIAATHSAIASSQSRSDPEGIKRAFYFFRACAGMLTYINENFLHAPSTDLSREVVKFLVSIILAQATEVFFEKCTDEKKGSALVSKIGSQAAYMYTTLTEEVKEFMGKGIFERNWVTLIQIKAKYFSSLAQYYRALADSASSKHGDALARLTLAETHAKEASRLAVSFSSSFTSATCPTLPADAGTSIAERTKAHLALISDKKAEAQRENDLIYNAVIPAPEALSAIDKTAVATPIPIQEIYGTPEVQKTIGQDIFLRLVPLSVHESASVYSEEKAKLVRGEVEKAEGAEGEVRSALESMGVKSGLVRFRAMAEGDLGSEEEVPVDVRRWKEDITLMEEREPVEGIMRELSRLKDNVKRELDDSARDLEIESRECEMMRVKYDHQWTQDPSSGLTKDLRTDLRSHYGSLEAASKSDQQVIALWETVKGDVAILMSPEVENVFRASTERGAGGDSLLDLDVGEGDDSRERTKIGQLVNEIDERLGRLNKISRERNEVLKDLKEKIQSDDVSHLLLLNRRNTGVEPALFAAELEKFRPYQQRLAATIQHQNVTLQEVSSLWKTLRDIAGRGPGARKWEEREKRKKDTVKRFSRARDGYMEVKDGLAKGLHFYTELTQLTATLRQNVKSFVARRATEREGLAGKLEVEKRLSAASSPPPLAAKPPVPPPPSSNAAPDLASSFGSMNIRSTPPVPATSPPVPPAPQSYHSRQGSLYSQPQPQSPAGGIPPPTTHYNPSSASQAPSSYLPSPGLPPPPPQRQQSSYMPPPPPSQSYSSPPPPQTDPYAGLGLFNPGGSGSSATSPPPQHQPPQQQQQYYMPPAPSAPPSAPPPPPQQYSHNPNQYQYQQQQQQQQYGFPPPPPSQQQGGGYGGYGHGYGISSPPPPPQQQQQQQPGGYPGFPPPPPQGYGGYNYGQR